MMFRHVLTSETGIVWIYRVVQSDDKGSFASYYVNRKTADESAARWNTTVEVIPVFIHDCRVA